MTISGSPSMCPHAAPSGHTDTVLETLFSTEVVPALERLALFNAFLTRSRHGTRVLSRRPELFTARVRAAQLGNVEVSELTAAYATVARTPALIRACDPDVYDVIAPLSGRTLLSQAGRDTELVPGQMALRTSGRPFELRVVAQHGPARLIRAQVPRTLLTQRRVQLDRLLAAPIPGTGGIGNLFIQFLTGLAVAQTDPTDRAGDYLPGDMLRLGNLTVDMFDALLAHVLDGGHQHRHQQVLLAQVDAHIRENLGDPELSPETVAAAHHISVSYLHRLFVGRETTVGATIRTQRLDRARRDLTDPRLAHLPVHRIAARWGFRDHATFTRAFRARYGLPPRAMRAALLDGPRTDDEATSSAPAQHG